MEYNFDTIAAIITPFALSAVGIIRISGSAAIKIANEIFSKKIKPKEINYGFIRNEDNKVLDEVILLAFLAPHSYSGEDVVEIQMHGNPAILNAILELVLNKGARLAQRGEFTKRAFLNHRIDLSQAEAVLDVIQSKSIKSAQSALSNLGGYLKNRINFIKKDLIDIYSKIIASIDFPDDVREVENSEVLEICEKKINEINDIIKNSKAHDFIRDGFSACLIGKPNAGKSSLFNSLLNYSRAIVTPYEGTTRDTIKETINLDGYMLNLVDTAGIRDKNDADAIEKIGIENSYEAIKNSDIILFLFENNIDEIDKNLIDLAKDKKYLFIKTKADLNKDLLKTGTYINISALSGYNIDSLKVEILNLIKTLIPENSNYTTNKRHQDCLNKAHNALVEVIKALSEGIEADIYSIDLKQAILSLDEITGEVLTDKILDNIFDNFCIGK